MKNYLDKNDDSNFILGYKIVKDKIVVKLKPHKKYTIPYTNENEENLLKIMKDQVNRSKNYLIVLENEISKNASNTKFDSVGSIISSIIVICSGGNLIFLACTGGLLSNAIINLKKYRKYKSIFKDIEKNLLYLDNEKLINDNEEKYNINSIDKMSLKQLKNIIRDAKIEKALNVSSSSIKQQTNYSTSSTNKSIGSIVNTNNSSSNLVNQNSNNSNNDNIEELQKVKELLNTLSEEEINLLRDITGNNLYHQKIFEYVKMLKEEKDNILNKPKVNLKKK